MITKHFLLVFRWSGISVFFDRNAVFGWTGIQKSRNPGIWKDKKQAFGMLWAHRAFGISEKKSIPVGVPFCSNGHLPFEISTQKSVVKGNLSVLFSSTFSMHLFSLHFQSIIVFFSVEDHLLRH